MPKFNSKKHLINLTNLTHYTVMKKYINLGLILFLAACSATEGNKSAELQKLEGERDKLKIAQADIAKQLENLDEKIQAAGGEDLSNTTTLVSTGTLALQEFSHYFEIQGSLEAEKSIVMSAEMGGIVKKINVQEGQRVTAGQVILELDKQLIEQSINELKEALNLAKFVFEKQEKLWAQNIGSELQYRQAKTNYESLDSKYKQAQTQRSKSFIIAPFSGVVEDILPKVGEMAAPGMPVVRIVNLDQLQVKAQLSEGYLGKVKYGNQVSINFPSIGKTYPAKIVKIGSSINPNGRTFEVGASLSNAGKDLLPNLIAKVKFRDYVNEKAVVVPTQAILQDIKGNSYVFVITKGKEMPVVKKQAVKLGLTYDNNSEIIDGLEGGEEIVLDGVRSINDGDKVSIAKK